jgi:VIT1/CCC1 family predicted Fe2+/Mn2+ transporter
MLLSFFENKNCGVVYMQHTEQHLKSSEFITDVVIGMSDGLTVPFALAAGLSGAVSSNGIIITAGLAEIAAGSIAMGLGGYLAGRTEMDHYESELKREYEEVEKVPEKEMDEVREIFAGYGLSIASQNLIAVEIAKDKDKWVSLMMKHELGLERPNPNRAKNSALTIGVSYVTGGLIPLTGYFFLPDPRSGLIVSAIITVACLFTFGFFKSKLTGQPVLKGAVKVTLIGIIAAASAFLIAKLIT